MNIEIFDQPFVYAIVMTLIVVALIHLFFLGANAAGWNGIANFFTFPSPQTAGGN